MKGVAPVRHYINRHAKMRKHKRYTKEKHSDQMTGGRVSNLKLYADKCRDYWGDYHGGDRNGGYHYWETLYLTGSRKFAKQSTNRKIRAQYRSALSSADINDLVDVQALSGSDYEKAFDYAWTLW